MRVVNRVAAASVLRRSASLLAVSHKPIFPPTSYKSLITRCYSVDSQETTQQFNTVKDDSVQDLRNKLLDTAVQQFVPLHGWTEEALTQAVKFHGLSPMAQSQIFEKAQVDLIQHFITKANQYMSQYVQMTDKSTMSERDILRLAIKVRLEQVAPYVANGTWTDAMSSYIIGPRGPLDAFNQVINELTTTRSNINFDQQSDIFTRNATYQLAILADEISFLMGQHKDVDLNWYAKRAAIAGIYASTEIYMLNDKSEGFKDTWEFLDRRIDNALALKGPWDALSSGANFWFDQFSTIWGMKK